MRVNLIFITILLLYVTFAIGTLIKFKINKVPSAYNYVAIIMPIIFLVWAPLYIEFEKKSKKNIHLMKALINNYKNSIMFYPILVGYAARALTLASKQDFNNYQTIEVIWPSYGYLYFENDKT
ncbi:MAG: hypothetical protein H6Q70_4651 [Firmicutes bacterium]|nr:hypothetical protein [Bacillota bacterium]